MPDRRRRAGRGRAAGEAVVADLLARPDVEFVHLRNVGYGCYNFGVRANG
jgi:hypothetical protein